MFELLARFINHHAKKLIVALLLFVAFAVWFGPPAINKLSPGGFETPGTDWSRAQDQITANFRQNDVSLVILASAKDGTPVSAPVFQQHVAALAAEAKRIEPKVLSAQTYYTTHDPHFVSKDGRTTYIAMSLAGADDNALSDEAQNVRAHLDGTWFNLRFGGGALINYDVTQQIKKDLTRAETVSFILLGILLVIVFRGVVAAFLPLVLGGFSIVGALVVLRLLLHVMPIVTYALNVITLIGLGLAIDYSLLIVSRFREELVHEHGDTSAALKNTVRTAGRTVFFSGLTVMISLSSLIIFPMPFLRSMGWGGSAAVLVAMVSALVLLPVILRLLGKRVNWLSFGRARAQNRAMQDGKSLDETESIWHKTGRFFMHRPWRSFLATLVLLLLAGSPFLHAKLALPEFTVMPKSSSTRQVTETLQTDFGFTNNPIYAMYTAQAPQATNPQAIGPLYDYVQQLQKLPGVTSVTSLVSLPGAPNSKLAYQHLYAHPSATPQLAAQVGQLANKNVTMVIVNYGYDTTSTQAQQLVKHIRGLSVPHGQVAVGGYTALLVDVLAMLHHYLPYAVGIIMLTLLVLLFLMLGSVVIPLKAMLLNLLSLSASFGALVWVFQDGHVAQWLGFNVTGNIDATQPVLIFAVAFGLSMDYAVFLYSRIKEQHDKGGTTETAVLSGLQKSGSIITSAAMLLFVVVVAFTTSKITVIQQIGLGLAIAVVVDAFIVRMVLVPSLMRLLNKWNWWAPGPLKRFQRRLDFGEKA